MITIATWNVNSVKSRLAHLQEWLKAEKPDIVLLQELKCLDEAFPKMEIEDLGYNIAVHGQKTYNGVAILSKFPLEDVRRGLPGDENDIQARYIEAVVSIPPLTSPPQAGGINKILPPLAGGDKEGGTLGTRHSALGTILRVASVYVPNGQDAESDKFQYKLKFLDRLQAHMKTLLGYGEMLVVGGDYNIAPEPRDVHDPASWEGSVLTHDEVRMRFRKILNLGMYDAFRVISDQWPVTSKKNENTLSSTDHRPPTTDHYTWWDYRAGAFPRDNGLRIDHLLLSAQAADALTSCAVHKQMRALDKPSDHAPVILELAIPLGEGEQSGA